MLTIGQPNADTNYAGARIAPGGTYRLRGKSGSMNQTRLARRACGAQGSPARKTHDFNTLKVDAEGCCDVILSPARPAGYTGDWWQVEPMTNTPQQREQRVRDRRATLQQRPLW